MLSMHREAADRRTDVLSAVAGAAVETCYQPIVDMRDGRVVGWEALSRFPGLPFATGEIFEAVQGTDLEVDLDLACLEKAMLVVNDLVGNTYLSVNLSPAAITSSRLEQSLGDRRESLERVVIEITERTGIDDYLPLYKPLHHLRQRLVSVAVDDVGAGYASLWHITQLLPDIIKIDRALISGIDHSPTKRAIVTALISLARELRCTIVAEGVEEAGEADWLRGMGMRFGQGYHFARPEPWTVARRRLNVVSNGRLEPAVTSSA